MVAVLQCLDSVEPAIARAAKQASACGLLVGLRDGSTTLVTAALHCDAAEFAATQELAGSLLPPPLAVVGAYAAEGSPLLARSEAGSVAAAYTADSGAVRWAVKQGGSLEAVQPQALALGDCATAGGVLAQLAERYTPVRFTAELVLSVSGQGPSSLAAAFDELKEQLCGLSSVFVIMPPSSSSGGSGALPVAPTLPGLDPFSALGASWSAVPVLRPYQRNPPPAASAAAAAGGGGGCAAPQLAWAPGQQALSHAQLCLDVLALVPLDMPAAEAVGSIVRPAVRRQLAAMRLDAEEAAAAGREVGVPSNTPPLRALHFLPPGLPHHITLVYPLPLPSIEADEEALLPRRKALHRLLGLPPNQPLLRVANAADFSAAGGGGGAGGLAAALAAGGTGGKPRLQDVHLGLPSPPIGGSVHLVQGSYDYFHYMQDKFDDSGWGCAYRSLQTICSWFARQHYAARPPPSHREIQAALVSIGDKDAAFIGSRQWIGAIELGFILDTLLGVSHKVLTVQSGDDMPSLARQIAHHFDTQGTPIMIGGGVLAYTLLGIDYDERSGRAAFLILDPHYTGPEDLKKIHAGQWVAWKQPGDKAAAGGDLFVSGSFYNLLCPQRPTTV